MGAAFRMPYSCLGHVCKEHQERQGTVGRDDFEPRDFACIFTAPPLESHIPFQENHLASCSEERNRVKRGIQIQYKSAKVYRVKTLPPAASLLSIGQTSSNMERLLSNSYTKQSPSRAAYATQALSFPGPSMTQFFPFRTSFI